MQQPERLLPGAGTPDLVPQHAHQPAGGRARGRPIFDQQDNGWPEQRQGKVVWRHTRLRTGVARSRNPLHDEGGWITERRNGGAARGRGGSAPPVPEASPRTPLNRLPTPDTITSARWEPPDRGGGKT